MTWSGLRKYLTRPWPWVRQLCGYLCRLSKQWHDHTVGGPWPLRGYMEPSLRMALPINSPHMPRLGIGTWLQWLMLLGDWCNSTWLLKRLIVPNCYLYHPPYVNSFLMFLSYFLVSKMFCFVACAVVHCWQISSETDSFRFSCIEL